jgi:signal transduction histidine kinase/CheY-like chemotaxis protein
MLLSVSENHSVPLIPRRSLCMSSPYPGVARHAGENGFEAGIAKQFLTGENNAAEKLVQLKADLANVDGEEFWQRLMEGMTDVAGAQYSFVAKRILVDDHDSAIEMPPIGEEGACLLGVAFYFNNGANIEGYVRDYKYKGWSCPCAHMRHDKVFLVPDNLGGFIDNNPNKFPFPCESYIGVPLFSEGKCFAHFGLMYTREGLRAKDFSWGFTEMLLHSLEDIIKNQLLFGQGFAKTAPTVVARPTKVIPQNAITASQSLKPYAKSLSHEFRTPMQGVVGMLDVMHATVQDSIEEAACSSIRNTFHELKQNIEMVQDSSRRAVEAADNVVYAYGFNMQVPDTPQDDGESPTTKTHSTGVSENRPNILIEGSNISVNPYKRRRSSPVMWNSGNPTKKRDLRKSPRQGSISPKTGGRPSNTPIARLSPKVEQTSGALLTPNPSEDPHASVFGIPSTKSFDDADTYPTPGSKHTNIRELIPMIIHDSLFVGGRPDSAITESLPDGERIEVRTRSSNGHSSAKTIEWSVSSEIPEALLVDERDLAKLISCIFLNAVKFTENGRIKIIVRSGKTNRFILINIIDTGTGISEDFLPELFKPFSQKDESTTRSKDGLGLGLMVAKGLSRKIGGDLTLVRSETDGPNHGSDFEIKVPVDSAEGVSRPGTPRNRTPTPTGPLNALPKMKSLHTFENSVPRSPKLSLPLQASSPARENAHIANIANILDGVTSAPRRSSLMSKVGTSRTTYDKKLSEKYPLTFLVAEDNKINRKLLVNMLNKFGYRDIYEAFDGVEAVRIMKETTAANAASKGFKPVDIVLMDLWMPEMDGYEATEHILRIFKDGRSDTGVLQPTILAVSADATDEAIDRATSTGMEGFMTKPYKLMDLQRLIEEFCVRNQVNDG